MLLCNGNGEWGGLGRIMMLLTEFRGADGCAALLIKTICTEVPRHSNNLFGGNSAAMQKAAGELEESSINHLPSEEGQKYYRVLRSKEKVIQQRGAHWWHQP